MISSAQLRHAFVTGRRTPRDVVERLLSAWRASDRLEPPLCAFVTVDEAELRRQADESTRWLAHGQARSPLEGVPVAVKDNYDVQGMPTRAGGLALPSVPAIADAPSVARLRAAGALVAIRANMHELAVHPSGINVHHGVARNPFDPSRDTGGSSSGSAAAVAAGLVPIALGTDTGGSVRIPAGLCGLAGHKPTFGRVPTDGIVPLSWSLDHAGPLSVTVDDARLAFSILAGAPVERAPEGARLRAGIDENWWAGADAKVAQTCKDALRQAGFELVPIELPHVLPSVAAGSCLLLSEAASAHAPLLDGEAPLQASVRASIELGRGFTAVELLRAQRLRTELTRELARAFTVCDVVATPATAVVAPRYREDAFTDGETDESRIDDLVWFTFAANLTGQPATAVCAGAVDGLPVGVQFMAPAQRDDLSLAAAERVERTVSRPSPRISFDLLS